MCQLTRNGGWCSCERASNRPHTNTSLSHARSREAALNLKLLVNRICLYVHTLR